MIRYIFVLILSFAIISLFFIVITKAKHIWLINQSRRKGFTPKGGRPTMFHIRDLLIRGEKDLAIEMYCEIFGVKRQEAKEQVEEMERVIQQKRGFE